VKGAPAATLRNRVASRAALSQRDNAPTRTEASPKREREQATPKRPGAGTITASDWFGILAKITLPPVTGSLTHASLPHSRHRVVHCQHTTRMVTPDLADGMPCDAVRSLSFAACDGELNALDLRVIESHLERCAPCRVHCLSDAVFLRTIRAAVSLESAPQSLRTRVALILQPRAAEKAPT
jgi:hypothetical protein